MFKQRWFLSFIVLLMATMACSVFGGGSESADVGTVPEAESSSGEGPSSAGSGSVETDFPLPRKYDNLMEVDVGEGGINFQTPMSIEDVIAFYRDEFGNKLGYTEREYLTNIAEDNFQLVFDGHPGGVPIVIQGVAFGDRTNVNIRFEDA